MTITIRQRLAFFSTMLPNIIKMLMELCQYDYAIWCIHDYLFVCLDVWAVPGRVGSLHVRFQAGGEVLHINFSSVGEKLGASSGFDGKINLWSIWRNCAFVRRVGFRVIIPPEVAAEVFFVVFDQGKVEARITALLCTTGRSHTLISRLFGLRTHGIASLVKLCDRCTRRRRRGWGPTHVHELGSPTRKNSAKLGSGFAGMPSRCPGRWEPLIIPPLATFISCSRWRLP